jgi:energy-coupling factor transporter ATP-binding protein EcfA2
MLNRHVAALQAAGQIETCLRDLEQMQTHLEALPLWRPSAALSRQAAEARRIIVGMQARLERRLVVTLIGPSGAGKSTLLNALAGVDDLSPVGIQRPTTRQLVVLANDAEAVQTLFGTRIAPGEVTVRGSRAAESLDHLILVDTPDTDTTLSDQHMALLNQAVTLSDVLLCVFDAQNPKRRDHADTLAPLVRRFHGASLVAVLNKCDRLDQEEIIGEVGPDFETFLGQAWETTPEALFLTSARRHLQQPAWDAAAGPRHDLDQFDQLRELIFATFNRPGFGPDRRVANAARIRDYLVTGVNREAAGVQAGLGQTVAEMAAIERQAMVAALDVLRADRQRQLLGVHVRLYQALAQRWLGPVGWLVAIWSRLIVFGSGLTALVRFGNPLHQIWGLISSWRRFKESRSALSALSDQSRVDTAVQAYRKHWLTQWPGVAEQLISAGFDARVRTLAGEDSAGVARDLEDLWSRALEEEIQGSANRLSHVLLQVLFNLPGLALMGYVGWLTADHFFRGTYLSSDFFLHALLTLAIVLLISFFLLQAVVRLAIGRDRIQRRAFAVLENTGTQDTPSAPRALEEQIREVLALAQKGAN